MRNPGRAVQDLTICLLAATADCHSAIELGCGRCDNLALLNCRMKTGVDIYQPYLNAARERWGPVMTFLCRDMVDFCQDYYTAGLRSDAILMIDSFEHLDRDRALIIIPFVKSMAYRRVILFVPEGESPQDTDVMGMGGDEWQQHRSSWAVEDFVREGFDTALWPDFHAAGKHAIFAIWNQP